MKKKITEDNWLSLVIEYLMVAKYSLDVNQNKSRAEIEALIVYLNKTN